MRSPFSPSSAAAALALLGMALLPPRVGVAARQRTPAGGAAAVEWKTYGADLASTRFSPLDHALP